MQHKYLFLRKLINKMSAGGSAMIRGSTISSNKGAPANKNSFAEQSDSLNYSRNYHDALKNTETVIRLIDNREIEEDVLDTMGWAKPLNFQDSYNKISTSKQTAKATYLIFNIWWYCAGI